jgi:hypothetical protein
MRFARCEREPDRQAAAIDHRMYLAGQTASRAAHGLSPVAGDTSGVLMNTHNGRVDHSDRCIMRSSQCVHHPAPNASATPANEAVVASGIRTELLRQIPPDRNTQKMPFRTRRSFTRGMPRGLFGSIGLMAAHSWSVSS